MPRKRSTEPNSARWIMNGRWRALSGPAYSISNRCGSWKSTCRVDSCQRRPIASRTCTSTLGAQQAQHELEQAAQLLAELLVGAEDVRVVLGDAPHPGEPVQHP